MPSAAVSPVRPLQLVLAAVVPVLLLLPFVGKPFHVDDPLFVWQARQVATHPLDPYGFTGNWLGRTEPAYRFIQNPPLAAYYLAAVGRTLGWGEVPLHVGLLPISALTAVGTCLLAAAFGCRRPLAAALLLVATPAWLGSATTVMCDGPMVCLWVWAVLLFVRGSTADTGGRAWAWLVAATVVATAAVLTKYPAINLVPLLAGYAVLCPTPRWRRTLLPQAIALLLPIATLLAFNRATAHRYGLALVSDAIGFTHSTDARGQTSPAGRVLDSLCYIGGGGLPIVAVAVVVLARGRRWPIVPVVAVAVSMAAADWFHPPRNLGPAGPGEPAWVYFAQCGLMATAGLALLGLGVVAARGDGRRGLFLALWVAGVAVFATAFNWTLNARSVLPLMPAAAILAVRAVEAARPTPRSTAVVLAAAMGGLVTVAVAIADARAAADNRTAAGRVCRAWFTDHRGATLWFGGHWGFQFYMEAGGARRLDADRLADCRPGDGVVLPLVNADNHPPPGVPLAEVGRLTLDGGSWLSTVDGTVGGGFYYSPGTWLPFAFGPTPGQTFISYRVVGR